MSILAEYEVPSEDGTGTIKDYRPFSITVKKGADGRPMTIYHDVDTGQECASVPGFVRFVNVETGEEEAPWAWSQS